MHNPSLVYVRHPIRYLLKDMPRSELIQLFMLINEIIQLSACTVLHAHDDLLFDYVRLDELDNISMIKHLEGLSLSVYLLHHVGMTHYWLYTHGTQRCPFSSLRSPCRSPCAS